MGNSRSGMVGLLLLVGCLYLNTAHAQKKISIHLGGGVGSLTGGSGNKQAKGRIKIQLNGYYNLSSRQSVGLELSASDNFASSLGGNGEGDVYDASTNTRTLEPANANTTVFLAKYKYFLRDEETFRPFVELGAGINTYSRKIFGVASLPSEKIKRSNFAIQPEIGFSLLHFQLSFSYLLGGSTPAFTGMVTDSGENIKLESRRYSAFYLNASYRFDF